VVVTAHHDIEPEAGVVFEHHRADHGRVGCDPVVAFGDDPAFGQRISHYNNGTISSATMLMILISGLIAGPAVSLYGSPTVSPVTAALWASEPLAPRFPS